MQGVAREGQAKPRSRHPRPLERPRTKRGGWGGAPRGRGQARCCRTNAFPSGNHPAPCLGESQLAEEAPISRRRRMRHRDRSPQPRLVSAGAAGR